MLNPRDALGLAEDLAVLGGYAGVDEALMRAARNHSSGATALAAATVVRIRQKDDQLASMRQDLHGLLNERNVVATLARANARVIQGLIGEQAKATGESEGVIRNRVNYMRSRELDKAIEDSLKDGNIVADPRSDNKSLTEIAPWYIPEYV